MRRRRSGRSGRSAATAGAALTAAALLWAAAPGALAAAPPDGGLRVVAGIDPVAWFAERIGGPAVRVQVLVAPGQDPHTYEPTPAQMAGLEGSRLYLRVGLPFEDRLAARVSELSPSLTVVDVGRGVPRRPSDGTDPHIWMSPRLAKTIARNVCDAFVAADPGRADAYRRRLAAVLSDLDALDAEVAAALAPLRGRTIYVFHDAFGYLADAYGLTQVAIETGGKEPGPRQVAGVIERARTDGVRVIFVQPQFSTVSAEAIAREIGGAVVPLDPLARDYLGNMRRAAQTIRKALAPGD